MTKRSEIAERIRFQEQCALSANFPLLRDAWTKAKKLKAPKVKGAQFDYDHLNVLFEKATVESSKNKMGANAFINRGAELIRQRAIIPYVKLYKVFPNDAADKDTFYEIPIGQVKATGKKYDAAKHGELYKIYRSVGSEGVAEIADIRCRLAGSQPAKIRYVDRLTFSLIFSDQDLLFKQLALGEERSFSYSDLFSPEKEWIKTPKKIEASSVGYLNCPGGDEDTLAAERAGFTDIAKNPDYFELIAEIGYKPSDDFKALASPSNPMHSNPDAHTKDSSDLEALTSYLRNSKLVVRLNYMQHTFQIANAADERMNPQIAINLEYSGWLENKLDGHSVNLLKDDETAQINKIKKQLGRAKALLSAAVRNRTTLSDFLGGSDGVSSTYKDLRNQMGDFRSGEMLITLQKGQKAMNINPTPDGDLEKIERVFKGDPAGASAHQTKSVERILGQLITMLEDFLRVRNAAYKSENLQGFFKALVNSGNVFKMSLGSKKSLGLKKSVAGPELTEGINHYLVDKKKLAKTRAATAIDSITVSPINAATLAGKLATLAKDTGDMTNKSSLEILDEIDKDELKDLDLGKRVFFITLGDLLDVAINHSTDGKGLKGLSIIMGMFSYIDEREAVPETKWASLAELPISWHSLMAFWVKHAVYPAREVYTLREFIEGIVGDLINRSFGEDCVDSALLKKTAVVFGYATAAYTGPKGPSIYSKKQKQSTWADSRPNPAVAHAIVTANQYKAIDREASLGTKDVGVHNYLLIHANNFATQELDLDYPKENAEKGVMVFTTNKGAMVQKASFTRATGKYVREARLLGRAQQDRLMVRDIYNSTVSMLGYPSVRSGEMIGIDPRKVGARDLKNWKKMGIGGFYVVTEITHSLFVAGEPTFSTSLSTQWVSFGGCILNKGSTSASADSSSNSPTKTG